MDFAHEATVADILALGLTSSVSSQLLISSSTGPLPKKLNASLVPQFL